MTATTRLPPRLEDARPEFRERLQLVLSDLRAQGFKCRPYEILRTPERAAELQRQGRSHAGTKSKHCQGLAADLVCAEVIGGLEVLWGASLPHMPPHVVRARAAAAQAFFQALGSVAKGRGLRWGGDFKTLYDPAHIELLVENS